MNNIEFKTNNILQDKLNLINLINQFLNCYKNDNEYSEILLNQINAIINNYELILNMNKDLKNKFIYDLDGIKDIKLNIENKSTIKDKKDLK